MKNYNRKVEYTCEICGNSFWAWHTHKTRTCSPECTSKLRRQMLIDLYTDKAGEPIEQFLRRRYVDELGTYRDLMANLGLTQVHTLKKLLTIFEIPIRKGSEAVKVQWIDNPERREQTRQRFVNSGVAPTKRLSPVEDCLRELARSAVNKAVKKGTLPRATSLKCYRCGEPADEYHHPSYEQGHWLEVEPLCQSCHSKEHGF